MTLNEIDQEIKYDEERVFEPNDFLCFIRYFKHMLYERKRTAAQQKQMVKQAQELLEGKLYGSKITKIRKILRGLDFHTHFEGDWLEKTRQYREYKRDPLDFVAKCTHFACVHSSDVFFELIMKKCTPSIWRDGHHVRILLHMGIKKHRIQSSIFHWKSMSREDTCPIIKELDVPKVEVGTFPHIFQMMFNLEKAKAGALKARQEESESVKKKRKQTEPTVSIAARPLNKDIMLDFGCTKIRLPGFKIVLEYGYVLIFRKIFLEEKWQSKLAAYIIKDTF